MKTYESKPTRIKAYQYFKKNVAEYSVGVTTYADGKNGCETLNGFVRLNEGDYIIYNEQDNEYYPCADDTFNRKYKEVK